MSFSITKILKKYMIISRLIKKRFHYYYGYFSEYLLIIYLFILGYNVLKRRFKTKAGEIDIIAKKGNIVYFIEVKARLTFGIASELLSVKQKMRIKKAAELYLGKFPPSNIYECHFELYHMYYIFFFTKYNFNA